MSVRLGLVSYLNAFPYLYGLEKLQSEDFSIEVTFGTPTELNKKMDEGELEIALISSIEAARHPDRYGVLPDLGLGVKGACGSVLLFCKIPLVQLEGKVIAVTSASATGSVLLRILLQRCWNVRDVSFQRRMTLKGIRDQFPAVLLIGDEALQAQENWTQDWVLYDLARVWNEWTGLPFVFALWGYPVVWAEKSPQVFNQTRSYLKQGIAFSQQHWDQMLGEAKRRWSHLQPIESYLGQFDYFLEPSHQDGLVAFYQWARRIGEEEIHVKLPTVPVSC